ncbi:hypothetical protein [Brevibacterium sp. FAM 24630]|uniref:hypothetical protein n=1 Tax=unclassified Brevibacterium TaxID=2614124 RepID=UPI003C7D075F
MERLRAAGCVFAEDEAAILLEAAHLGDPDTKLVDLVARRVAGEPLEQIVGWVDFAGLRLNVLPGMFVPRQRTRQLAEATASAIRDVARRRGAGGAGPVVLEVFCGVGPVASVAAAAVTAASVPDVQIHLGDVQAEAVRCAVRNVTASSQAGAPGQPGALGQSGMSGHAPRPGITVHGHTLDCLHGLPEALRHRFSVIAAVPPYVPETAADFLPREAVDFEPARALFAGPDGLDLVRRLIIESTDWLAADGVLLIELGREQAADAAEFATAHGMHAHSRLGEDELTITLELRPVS